MKNSLLLARLKRQGRNHMRMVPCCLTFLNACFGFLSLLYSFDGCYHEAAIAIFCAMAMDLFDGRIARMLGVAGELGGALDSLADAISFGIAPVLLIYSWRISGASHWFAIAILGTYVCAGLWRLARFNTTASSKATFVGLPIPIAASCLTSLVLYERVISVGMMSFLLTTSGLYLLLIVLAVLMVSTIPFPSGKGSHLVMPFGMITVLIAMLAGEKVPIFPLLIVSYIIFGPWLIRRPSHLLCFPLMS